MKNKKIVSFTMIKNEADIAEYFVRYTANFVDTLVFIDNGCVDGTIDILNKLKEEGIDIRIYNESNVYYEQFRIENKYLHMLAKENFDYIIPLDADEFLSGEENFLKILDSLNEDKVTMVKWRTFCINEKRLGKSLFKQNNILRFGEENPFTKVIIPTKLVRDTNLLIEMGHHNVLLSSEFTDENDSLYVAHFPVRSIEQIKLKIYQGTISQLMSSYKGVVAFHWKTMLEKIQKGQFDLIQYSREYALVDEDIKKVEYIEHEFDTSWCKNKIKIKYGSYVDNELDKLLYTMNLISCIKSIIETDLDTNKKPVLIYGIGNTLKKTIEKMDLDSFIIAAYIDSDENKFLEKYNGKLIITPEYIKFLKYKYIVIASIYEKEIINTLNKYGVSNEKIIDYKQFINLCLEIE